MTSVPHSPPPRKRPLSPHLQIYRPMLTMMMSIAHRITGVALYLGLVVFAVWLLALSSTHDVFSSVNTIFISPFGLIVLFGLSWSVFHHLLGGVRHAIWDLGYGMEHPQREYLAWATLLGGIILTILAWTCTIFCYYTSV